MKVILQKNVQNLGDAGDVKEVAGGYARNYLIPRKLVIPYRAPSAKAALHRQEIIRRKIEKRNKEMQALSGKIQDLKSLEIKVKIGANNKLFGSVTAAVIASALKDAGYEIDKRKIELSEKIKMLGDYKVKIKLTEEIVIPITVQVVPEEIPEQEESDSEKGEEDLDKGQGMESDKISEPDGQDNISVKDDASSNDSEENK